MRRDYQKGDAATIALEQAYKESIFPQDLIVMLRAIGFRDARFVYATFRNRHPSLLGRTQSLVSALPAPRAWERFVHPWFILVGEK